MLKNKKTKILLIVFIVLILSGLLALYFLYNPSNSSLFPKCIFYSTTGLHCPGCGSQRAIHDILQGNIITGLKHNLLLILLIAIVAYKSILFGLKKTTNKVYKDVLQNSIVTKSILVLVILFWILRNIDRYPFTLLAP